MARKTLGKMEFADLIKNLQEQNSSQLEAQQETTKSIRNLTTYFLKQDRAEVRRKLEDVMETRKDAQKVVTSKGKGIKDAESALIDKGLNLVEAQQQTTKSIQDLQAYFFKQDRAETRRRLEDKMEEKTSLATPVSSSSGKGGGSPDAKGLSKMLSTKGIAGILSNFLSTALLGAAGSSMLKTALGSMVANKAFLLGFGRLFGGLLILPKVWESITKGIEDYQQTGDIKSAITEAVLSFFRVTDGWSVLSNIGAGATAGFVAAGPPGIIAGALLGGGISLLQLGFGKDTTKDYGINILDFLTSTPGMTIFGGTLIMKKLMKSKSTGLKKLAGRGLRGGIAAMLLYPALDMIQGGFTEDPNATDIKSKIKNFLFSSKHKGMDMGYSNLDAAAIGALTGFTAFGLPGALVGGILGLTYRALDEGSREFDGKTMFDRIKERLYMMFDTVFLQIEAWSGNEDAEKELARRENQEKIVEARREVLDFLLDPLDNVETLLEQAKKGGFENAFTSMNQPVSLGARQRTQLMSIRENLPDDLKSKIVTGDKPENYKLNLGALGDPNMLNALLRSTGKKDTDLLNLDMGSFGNWAADKLGFSQDGGKIVLEDNKQVILDAIKAIQELEGNVKTNARGAQVYRKPTLALVAEKPGTAEYIMSDANLARLANTIATQKENQTMSSMIPIMMGQGGGGTSMPVINNSYSYQNTENTVREMPTTSSLNMMTALA